MDPDVLGPWVRWFSSTDQWFSGSMLVFKGVLHKFILQMVQLYV